MQSKIKNIADINRLFSFIFIDMPPNFKIKRFIAINNVNVEKTIEISLYFPSNTNLSPSFEKQNIKVMKINKQRAKIDIFILFSR